ncbi:ArnT family glycosyltransferase [Nocardia terpenica]|uniref:Glycosyl transferase n=1 Tax=Nocardia terpenica TaxID=455432 RepID=A0A164PMX8_9NOCA|nr:glycosyltransferase family 39 protein [Nocardia terpenica]KZM75793.1 glycosyl transferase [Nocardia terpenica]NQE86313.1 glycosyltransferase family 39 protein [Nocardia terpenica]
MLSVVTETASVPVRPARDGDRTRRWEYPALAALLIGTAIAYLWNLSVNGWANSFYAAAVQSGARSWKAFFFGSSDWGNSITVDKTPASLWPMEISARVFGMHSWSMLLPQALLAVASVALVWITLRRTVGATAGLLGGLALAVTPVAALMFRFNNPDALLVFLMLAAVWAMTRALEDGRWRWLVACGALVGFGFLAKQLQVLLVVPALALTYLIAGPPKLGTRLLQLLAAGGALIAGAGWWVLIAQLWPADSRPYFGGSKDNSILQLTFGYNGLQRLGVGEGGGGFPGPPGGGDPAQHQRFPFFGSSPGLPRLFSETVGGQIAWLIPAALVLLVAALVLRGRAARTDPQRAALLLWGGWGVVTGLVFTFMRGIFHQYYTVALAPAVAGTVGLGAVLLWRDRDRWWVRTALALTLALTTVTAVVLLSRTPEFVPWLRWAVAVPGALATLALLFPRPRRLAAIAATAAIVTAAAGPVAYSMKTIATAHEGGIVIAGPRTDMSFAFRGGMPFPGAHAPGGKAIPAADPAMGGPGQFRTPGKDVLALLAQDGNSYTWAAATVSSMGAADYQLALNLPIMPVGGFSGGDPAPTLDRFQKYVADHRIHYFIGSRFGGGGGPGRTNSVASQINRWVTDTFTPTTVDGVTVYDLTAPKAR